MTAITAPVTLPNSTCGAHMYAQGFGTWQGKPEEVKDAVKLAIKSGYRLIDCARIYRNQKAVGEAISESVKEGTVKREDLFIVSKVWNTDHEPAYVEATTKQSINDLQCGYLDLLLIHWPVAWPNPTPVEDIDNQTEFVRVNPATGGSYMSDTPLLTTYKAMEALVDAKLVKDIGVSNFTIEEIEALLAPENGIKYIPVANQVEAHPALPQDELQKYCESKGIKVMAYCPLGLGMETEPNVGLIYDENLIKIAKDNGFLSAAALCLQYSSQRGFICLSKSVTPSRIQENANTPFGGISEAVMAELKAFGEKTKLRVCNPGMFREVAGPFFA